MDELTLLEISIYSRISNKLSHMHKRTQELACECVMFEGQLATGLAPEFLRLPLLFPGCNPNQAMR